MNKPRLAHIGKIAIFGLLVFIVVAGLSYMLKPKFDGDARYSVQGIYEQPENSIEVAAIDTSTLRKAFSPNYLYANYGISSWNSCTNGQPLVSSYYLLKDMMDKQGGLKLS